MEINDLCREVEHVSNSFGNEGLSIAEHMCSGSVHRTVQNKFFGDVVMNSIRLMAKNYRDHNYDARNEAACELANAIWDLLTLDPTINDQFRLRLDESFRLGMI